MADWSQTQPHILAYLRRSGPRSLSGLAYDLGLAEGVVAAQLAELERAGRVAVDGSLYAATIAPAAPPALPFSPRADQPADRKEGTAGATPPGSDSSPREAPASAGSGPTIVLRVEIPLELLAEHVAKRLEQQARTQARTRA